MASDLIERTVHEGGETRSRIDPGGGVSEVGGQEWDASEHAGPAGQESREGPPIIYSAPGGTAGWRACDALSSIGGVENGSISEIPAYTPNRWGDYSGVGIDPLDQTKVWVAGEYALNNGTGSSEWGTFIAEVGF